MTSNPFKNFIPYVVEPGTSRVLRGCVLAYFEDVEAPIDFTEHISRDPMGGEWRHVGFVPPLPGRDEIVWEIALGMYLLAVQFNERILPGKVRDEHLAKKVAEVEEREGRKVYKNEYAQLRDQVESVLLTKAFIRRSTVYVMVSGQYLYIFTSSAKKADDVFSLMLSVDGLLDRPRLVYRSTVERPDDFLRKCAGQLVEGFDGLDAGVLKHPAVKGAVIRFKGNDVGDEEIATALEQGYLPTELRIGLHYDDSDEDVEGYRITFTMTDKLVFKSVEVPGVSIESGEDHVASFVSSALLVAHAIDDLMGELIEGALGGLYERDAGTDRVDDFEDEDDEL